MAGRRRVSVDLAGLTPGDAFRLAGVGEDDRRYELVAHTLGASLVREIRHAEQIEFTRAGGTEVAFGASRSPAETFASGTRVVVL